ncbi:MAG: F0F1 ATP synthase subunit A [Akkermansiaceae bacterium]|nr:F0F1 ATP synthase subunit A [Akkermansiaceae bacterium]
MFSIIRFFTLVSAVFFASASSSMAAEGHDHLPASAEVLFEAGWFKFTNSTLMMLIVAVFLIVVAQLATRKITLVPSRLQNFVEWILESLLDFLSGVLGESLAKRTFWFFGTLFIMILFSNWMGLIPGVGTIGWFNSGPGADPHDTFTPLLRGANADLNMTSAMAIAFAILWFYWAVTETSPKEFFAHIFAPKGKFEGVMLVAMIVIFGFVGVIEVLSIAFRPVALMFRLYGNVYAGENMLESIMNMVPIDALKWTAALPFYFLELLVGLIQALVFTLLCAVFLRLICEHDHDDEHAH